MMKKRLSNKTSIFIYPVCQSCLGQFLSVPLYMYVHTYVYTYIERKNLNAKIVQRNKIFYNYSRIQKNNDEKSLC